MAQSVVIEIGVDDQGTPVLKNVSGELDKLKGKTNEAGDASEKMSGQNQQATAAAGKMSPAMVAAGAAVAGIAVAAAAAAAGVVILVKGIQSSIEAFREQDEVNRRLERSLRRTGASGAPLREELDAIGASISQLAVDTNFGDEELSRMASTFIDMSGNATATGKDLELIADISAGMGTDGAAAARMYANALNGQLRPTMARTTALTEEQITAINEATDETDRARLAQEALSAAYGGSAKDINPLFRATKNLEDAQGDLVQSIGQVFAEGGALEPVIDVVTAALRSMESWVNENAVAIQQFVIDGVIFAVEAVQSLIGTIQRFAPVISLMIEYVQMAGRNFSIYVSSINIVIRSVMAFQKAVQAGVVNVLINVLDAGIAVAEFFKRDIPESVRSARSSLVDIGEGIEEDMTKHLDSAGDSVQNITDKFNEQRGALGRIVDGSAGIATGLQGANDVAGDLLNTLQRNRAAIGELSDEEDREGTGRGGPSGEDGAGVDVAAAKEAEKNAVIEQMAQEHQDRIAQIRMAALTEEDERMAIILENEAQRQELASQELSDAERQLEMMRLEMQLARDLGAIDEEEHQEALRRINEKNQAKAGARQTEEDIERRRQQEFQNQISRLDAQIKGIGTLGASFHELAMAEWDFSEASEATASAMGAVADLGGSVANAITEDKEKAAKIEAAFSAAAAIGSFAAFAATGFTAAPLGIAAAQHGIAAAQYAAIGGGGGASKKPSSASASARGGGGRSARDAQMIDREQGQGIRPIVFNNNFNGTFMEDSNAIDRKISNASQRAAQNRFVAGRGRGR